MKIKVAILGAKGRMGTESVKAISAADDLELVASLDLGDSLDLLKSSGAEVVLEFTHPDSVMKNLEFAISNGIHVVVGTTGFDSKRIEEVKALLAKNPQVGAIIAPNFGLGAVLMMQFAAKAATYFESVEIIELHHPEKADAPSGTATRTAELISDARAKAKKSAMPDKPRGEPNAITTSPIANEDESPLGISGKFPFLIEITAKSYSEFRPTMLAG